jgi:hypothetical protein
MHAVLFFGLSGCFMLVLSITGALVVFWSFFSIFPAFPLLSQLMFEDFYFYLG